MVATATFRHSAFMYASDQEYVAQLAPFISEGVHNNELVMVVVGLAKIDLLRVALGADASAVRFEDMLDVGTNPARIIPAWMDFVTLAARAGQAVRGVGEPVYPGRSNAELDECIQHEALLNVAFNDGVPWSLTCPYDTKSLLPDVLAIAHGTHPIIEDCAASATSSTYRADDADQAHLARPVLPPPPAEHTAMTFDAADLSDLRQLVRRQASEFGIGDDRVGDFVLAASEIAANSVAYGGGRGMARLWRHETSIVCEITDRGVIPDPLAGRRRPDTSTVGGRGLWLANALCDLVQLRSDIHGTTVRLHMRRTSAGL